MVIALYIGPYMYIAKYMYSLYLMREKLYQFFH